MLRERAGLIRTVTKGALMEPIVKGMQGPAVEDVQSRLVQLGFTIADDEISEKRLVETGLHPVC